MVSPSVRDVVGVKGLVYTATASADEFESMSIRERSEKYFARACSITGEAVNGNRNQPAVCAVDLATGREVSVVADCVFQKVEDALQKVSSADAVGRVAVLVTESRLAQGHDKNFQGQTLAEQLGLAGTAERMRMKRKACVQSDDEWAKAIERIQAEEGRDCFGEAQAREHAELDEKKSVAQGRTALAEVYDIASGKNAA